MKQLIAFLKAFFTDMPSDFQTWEEQVVEEIEKPKYWEVKHME